MPNQTEQAQPTPDTESIQPPDRVQPAPPRAATDFYEEFEIDFAPTGAPPPLRH